MKLQLASESSKVHDKLSQRNLVDESTQTGLTEEWTNDIADFVVESQPICQSSDEIATDNQSIRSSIHLSGNPLYFGLPTHPAPAGAKREGDGARSETESDKSMNIWSPSSVRNRLQASHSLTLNHATIIIAKKNNETSVPQDFQY